MTILNQKEAVFQAINKVTGHTDGKFDFNQNIEHKKAVIAILVEGFNEGTIALASPQADMKKYVLGLINNWMRKDSRLNGGGKYIAKNPGSRSCVSDPVVKNLKALLTDPSLTATQRSYIQGEIDSRVAATKPTTKPVDMSLIPDNIKALLAQTEDDSEE